MPLLNLRGGVVTGHGSQIDNPREASMITLMSIPFYGGNTGSKSRLGVPTNWVPVLEIYSNAFWRDDLEWNRTLQDDAVPLLPNSVEHSLDELIRGLLPRMT